MSSDILSTVIRTLEELKRMHQLCYELLEQLNVSCGFLRQNNIRLPNEEKLASLLSKAMVLLEEINTEPVSDEFLQRKKPDKDFTETAKQTMQRRQHVPRTRLIV